MTVRRVTVMVAAVLAGLVVVLALGSLSPTAAAAASGQVAPASTATFSRGPEPSTADGGDPTTPATPRATTDGSRSDAEEPGTAPLAGQVVFFSVVGVIIIGGFLIAWRANAKQRQRLDSKDQP